MQNLNKTITGEKDIKKHRSYSYLVLDAVCSYLQSQQMISDDEMKLFRKQWIAKERE